MSFPRRHRQTGCLHSGSLRGRVSLFSNSTTTKNTTFQSSRRSRCTWRGQSGLTRCIKRLVVPNSSKKTKCNRLPWQNICLCRMRLTQLFVQLDHLLYMFPWYRQQAGLFYETPGMLWNAMCSTNKSKTSKIGESDNIDTFKNRYYLLFKT